LSGSNEFGRRLRSSLGAVSFGFFLVLVGASFIVFPLMEEIRSFAADLTLTPVIGGIRLPLPTSPHPQFYHILATVMMIWGGWLLAVCLIRVSTKGNQGRVTDTLSNSVFWLGTAYLLYQAEAGLLRFKDILAGIVVLIGVMIVIKALARTIRKR